MALICNRYYYPSLHVFVRLLPAYLITRTLADILFSPQAVMLVMENPALIFQQYLFHPAFLYEALWNVAGALFLVWLGRHLMRRDGAMGGRLLWAYLMVYTSGRVWIEMLRVDEAHHVLGLRLNVWTSVLVFLLGLVGDVMTSRRHLDDAIIRGDAPAQADARDLDEGAGGTGDASAGETGARPRSQDARDEDEEERGAAAASAEE